MAEQKLKIGFVLDTSLDPTDGVQQYVLRTAEWLAAQGHEVHYLVGETKERDLPNVHSLCKNIRVTFNGNKTTIPLWISRKKIRKFLHDQQFDVLHVQSPHHPFMAQHIILEAPNNTAVVMTFHILPYNGLARVSTKLLGIMLKPSLRRVDTMLAVSSAAAKFEQWAFGKSAMVSPNVFDYSLFAAAKPFERYDDGIKTILFLGRLVERKGCKYLLEAVSKIDTTAVPKFRVVVCGRGELLHELEQYVEQRKIENVEFAGFVTEEDKPRYYASADISVFPSTGGESFGIVLLEAMASGKAAVLAGNNPGYSTVMGPRPELLFTPQDTDTLSGKIVRLLNDEPTSREIAQWGAEYSESFDVKQVGPKLLAIYGESIAKRRQSRDN